jgi:hypothetical protein
VREAAKWAYETGGARRYVDEEKAMIIRILKPLEIEKFSKSNHLLVSRGLVKDVRVTCNTLMLDAAFRWR